MIPLLILTVVITLILKYLRYKVLSRNKPKLPENIFPDCKEAYEKLGKRRKERLEHWEKKQEETMKNFTPEDGVANFDKEMEFFRAKAKLERERPIPKATKYEGAFALFEMRQKERERKKELEKLREKIFGGVKTSGDESI